MSPPGIAFMFRLCIDHNLDGGLSPPEHLCLPVDKSCPRISKFLPLNEIRVPSGVTSLNGARSLNSNGAPTKYKNFSLQKKRSPLFLLVILIGFLRPLELLKLTVACAAGHFAPAHSATKRKVVQTLAQCPPPVLI